MDAKIKLILIYLNDEKILFKVINYKLIYLKINNDSTHRLIFHHRMNLLAENVLYLGQ